MYCPKSLDPDALSYEELRQITIKPPMQRRMKSQDTGLFQFSSDQVALRNPKKWLPPSSCMIKVLDIVNFQINYLFTLCQHDAALPPSPSTCIQTTSHKIEYDLGPDEHVPKVEDLLLYEDSILLSKKKNASRYRRKRDLSATPKKDIKRRLISSTPRKQKPNK
jgi:hypothetical protein